MPTPTADGLHEVKIIPLSDIFRLMSKSEMPDAGEFPDHRPEESR